MLRLAIIALAGAAAVYAQAMFEGGSWFGEEDLKGRPKTVKIEREKLGDASILQPEEEWEYSGNGNPLAHRQFADGKLVANESFEYDAGGRRTAITTRDAEGRLIREQKYRPLDDGSEEEIDIARGKQQGRTIRRFDDHGRVIELVNVDARNMSTLVQCDYDHRGRPLEARMFEGKDRKQVMRVRITYPGDNHAIITLYADGVILAQFDETEDGAGNELAHVLFEDDPQNKPATSSRIEGRDAEGNWTLKTLVERNPRTQVDEPVARLHRTIVYY